jgi:hypothetical protein
MGTLTTCSIWQKILLPNDDDIMALIMIQQSTKLIFFRGLALFYCYVEHTSSKKKHIKNELTAWFHDTGHWRNWIAFYSLHSSSCMLCKKGLGKIHFKLEDENVRIFSAKINPTHMNCVVIHYMVFCEMYVVYLISSWEKVKAIWILILNY